MKRKANLNSNINSQRNLSKRNYSINKIKEILALLGLEENKSKENKNDFKKFESNNSYNEKNNLEDISNASNFDKKIDEAQFIKTDNNYKNGFVNKEYIINKLREKNIFNKNEFYLKNVVGDGNCGYRCISLQIYGTENEYAFIRKEYIFR